MRLAGLLMLALASCVAVDAAEDEETSETEQAVWDGSGEAEGETVVVQGGLDPCWTGLCWPSSWPTDPGPGYTGDGGHGGGGVGHGGGDAGKPDPTPAPRDCTQEPTWEQCYACCDWNEKHSWGETCRRLKKRADRAACWRRLESELRPQCQKSCNRPGDPITTVAP